MTIKKYRPDSPKEYAFIGSSVSRLGAAMTGALLFQDNHIWIGIAVFFTWIGHEVSEYFKLQIQQGASDEKKQDQPGN